MKAHKLEKEILARTKVATRNPGLKRADIVEWAFGEICPRQDEVVVPLPDIGCNVCMPKIKDWRRR